MSRASGYEFVSVDTTALEADLISMYEQITGQTVQPSSPDRLFIAWVTSILVQIYAMINNAANQNIPSRAIGDNLDALGELFYGVERPAAQAAICTEQFQISEPQSFDITVPAGTRVTDASRDLYWETAADAVIPAGSTTVTVGLRCQTAGTAGNGWVAGQLNTVVDVFEYYASCTNLTESDGGSDAATDDEYYELLKASQDAYSTAGPFGAYAYLAKSVSTEIADVKVVRPKRAVSKTLTVHDGLAFMGGDGVDLSTLHVTGGTAGTDYTAVSEDGMITITISDTGALSSAATIAVTAVAELGGRIEIYALMEDGSPAGTTVKNLILDKCSADTARPLTDLVSVADPQTANYNIDLTYYVSEDSTSSAAEVRTAVEAAVAEYAAWQSARLGRDINPSRLIHYVMGTGLVKRVDVRAPIFTRLSDGSDHSIPDLASLGTTTIVSGGVEDD